MVLYHTFRFEIFNRQPCATNLLFILLPSCSLIFVKIIMCEYFKILKSQIIQLYP